MKFKIELEIIDDVDYDEIEEVDTMTELFNLDEEIDEEGYILLYETK